MALLLKMFYGHALAFGENSREQIALGESYRV